MPQEALWARLSPVTARYGFIIARRALSTPLQRRSLQEACGYFHPPPLRPPYRSNLSVRQQSCLITAALIHLLSSPPCHLVARGWGGGEKNEKRGKKMDNWLAADNNALSDSTAFAFFNIERCIGESSGHVSASPAPPRPPGSGATVSQLHPSPGLS